MDANERYQIGKRATYVGIIGNIILTAFKAIVGVLSGSLAMVADAFHSLSDLLSSFIVLWGLKFSQRPPDSDHHYGHGKAESIVAKLVAIILLITAAGIGYSAYKAILQPVLAIPTSLALWAAIISIICKEAMYQYTVRVANKIKSTAIKADAWHHRSDAMSSIAAFIGIGGALLGFPILDPVAGIVVAVMIGYTAVEIYWTAIKELMDQAPEHKLIESIAEITTSIEGIRSVHDIKGRNYGSIVYIDMKICVDKDATVEYGHNLAGKAKYLILNKHPEIEDVLIHVNPCGIKDPKSSCALCDNENVQDNAEKNV
jgi:cation diffusion facilitator family transporter